MLIVRQVVFLQKDTSKRRRGADHKHVASRIIDSVKVGSFKPCLENRNDPIGSEIRNDSGKYSHCELKCAVKLTKTSKNSSRGNCFYSCPRDENHPSDCKFFRRKLD